MDLHNGVQRLRIGFRQGIALIVLGLIIGSACNNFSPNGIPWVGSWSKEPEANVMYEGLQVIELEEAKMLYDGGVALFLDARGYEDFRRSHIPGALHFPLQEAESRISEIKEMADAGMIAVTYCHGVDCTLAAQLVRTLKANGLPSARPFVTGWSDWLNAGYPVEMGGE